MADAATTTRCGFCAILGAPNAGKSTLVNELVGAKVAIVTPKAQTTRAPVRGIAMIGDAQVVLIDTPGVFAPRRRLDRAMVGAAFGQAAEADIVALLIDASRLKPRADRPLVEDEELARLLGGLSDIKAPRVLVLNKIDTVSRERLLPLIDELKSAAAFEAVFLISALTGDGVGDFAAWLAARMPEGPFLYPSDQTADLPTRLLAAEVTREKLMLALHDELPYASAVETERWEEKKDGSAKIDQIIYVERDSQKAIVLGKGGQTIKTIGAQARAELEELLGRRIHLFLFVKVRPNWSEEPDIYRDIGLEFPEK